MNKTNGGLRIQIAIFLFGLIAIVTLASCGGGGGGITSVTPGTNGNGNNNTGDDNSISTTGTIEGTIVDDGLSSRSISTSVSGVEVVLSESSTGELVDQTVSDDTGAYKFAGIEAGETYRISVKIALGFDFDGDGLKDSAQVNAEIKVAAGQVNRCTARLGLDDTDGDGQPDSMTGDMDINDGFGERQFRERHRWHEGESDIDHNGDGQFDQTLNDADGDGIPNDIDTDDDNDGIADDVDEDANGNGILDVNEFLVSGTIEAIDEATITVDGVVYTYDELTCLCREHGIPVTIDELAVGMAVELEGYTMDDGTLYLTRIKITGDGTPPDDNLIEFRIKGTVEAVDGSTVTIDGVVYMYDENTHFFGGHGTEFTLDDLVVGINVEVVGYETEDGSLYLVGIKLEGGEKPDNGNGPMGIEFRVKGTVEAIDETTITIDAVVYTYDENTHLFGGRDNTLTWEDIVAGTVIEIEGYTTDDGSLYLVGIRLVDTEPPTDDNGVEFLIKGTIEAIDETTITIDGIVYTYDELTHLFGGHGRPVTLDELVVGVVVEIKGYTLEDGSLYLLCIRLEETSDGHQGGNAGVEFMVQGAIEAIDETTITIDGVVYTYDENTRIFRGHGRPATIDELVVGTEVEIAGYTTEDGTLYVIGIRLDDGSDSGSGDDGGMDPGDQDMGNPGGGQQHR